MEEAREDLVMGAHTSGRNKSCSRSYIAACNHINRQRLYGMHLIEREVTQIKRELTDIKTTFSKQADEVIRSQIPLSWSAPSRPTSRRQRLPLRKVSSAGPIFRDHLSWDKSLQNQTTPSVHSARLMLSRRRALQHDRNAFPEAGTVTDRENGDCAKGAPTPVGRAPVLDAVRQKILKKVSSEIRRDFKFVENPWEDKEFVRRAMLAVELKYQKKLDDQCKRLAESARDIKEGTVSVAKSLNNARTTPAVTPPSRVSVQDAPQSAEHHQEVNEPPNALDVKSPDQTETDDKVLDDDDNKMSPSVGKKHPEGKVVCKRKSKHGGTKEIKLKRSWSGMKEMTKTCADLRSEIKDAVANLSLNRPPTVVEQETVDNAQNLSDSFHETTKLSSDPAPPKAGHMLATEMRAQKRRSSVYLLRMIEDEKRTRSTTDRLQMTRRTSFQAADVTDPISSDSDSDQDEVIKPNHSKLSQKLVLDVASSDYTVQ